MAMRSVRLIGAAGAVLFVATSAYGLAAPQRSGEPRVELSEEETVRRVKADVARRLRIDAGDVRTSESAPRTWPDAGLGCNARRGVFPPSPVPGFRIVVDAAGRTLEYHTDRFGRLLRCATPSKPLDPIK